MGIEVPFGPMATAPTNPWRSLTDLGRLHGISAVKFGRLLNRAGLRDASGQPSSQAITEKLAYGHHGDQPGRQTFWHQERCLRLLEQQGLLPRRPSSLVEQWAELLSALFAGSPSISTSAEQMAEDLPRELVGAVNSQLKARGCAFQVKARRGIRPGGGLPLACSPAPAVPADDLHRCG